MGASWSSSSTSEEEEPANVATTANEGLGEKEEDVAFNVFRKFNFKERVELWEEYWNSYNPNDIPVNPISLLDWPRPHQQVTITLPKGEDTPLVLAGVVMGARLHAESLDLLSNIVVKEGASPDDIWMQAHNFAAENVYFYVEVTEIRPGTTLSDEGRELYFREKLFVEDQAPSYGIVGGKLVPDTFMKDENFQNPDCAIRFSGWYPLSKLNLDSTAPMFKFRKEKCWAEMLKTPVVVRFGSFSFPINHLLPRTHKPLGVHRKKARPNAISEIVALQLANYEMCAEVLRKTKINYRQLLKAGVFELSIPLCYTKHVCHVCIETFNSNTLLLEHEKVHQELNETHDKSQDVEFHNYSGDNPDHFKFCTNLKNMATYFLPYKAGDDDCVPLMEYWTLSVPYSFVHKLTNVPTRFYNDDEVRKLFGCWNRKVLAGFFCRLNVPECAVSAVLVFPPFMKLGLGGMLLKKGMDLAKGRCLTGGSLERPFSQGGNALVIQYMKREVNPVISQLFLETKKKRLKLEEIQKAAHWVTTEDLAYFFFAQGILLDKKSRLSMAQFIVAKNPSNLRTF